MSGEFWQRSGLSSDLAAAGEELLGYWRVYGGARALVRSPALWLAFVLALVAKPLWSDGDWPDVAFAIVPSLLGFSLGAMAIVLAFPTTRMFELMAEGGREDSYYLDIAARLVHFIFVQVTTLGVAVVGAAYSNLVIGFFGVWLIGYALLTAATTALSLFGVAQLYNKLPPGGGDT